MDAQKQIARELHAAFPDRLDRVRAAALVGAFTGAISGLCGSSEDEAPRPRRVKGELRANVAVELAARPDLELSPTEIANVLGASAGAVANALDRLVSDGSAVLTCDRPRRFRVSGS
jgi:hypothetical protein